MSGVQLLICLKINLLASSPWLRRQSAPESLLAVESRNKQQLILVIDCISVSAQALIYPLTVASKSASSARKNAANQILKNMCEHSHQLVQQAVMVGSFPCLFAQCLFAFSHYTNDDFIHMNEKLCESIYVDNSDRERCTRSVKKASCDTSSISKSAS